MQVEKTQIHGGKNGLFWEWSMHPILTDYEWLNMTVFN